MGIKQLTHLISEKASGSVTRVTLETYKGKVLACNANLAIYRFLVTAQMNHPRLQQDDTGCVTTHLMGLFNRTLQLLEQKIRPIWVFEGRQPGLKLTEMERRRTVGAETVEEVATIAPPPISLRKEMPVQYPSGCGDSDNDTHEPTLAEVRLSRSAPIVIKQCAQKRKYTDRINCLETEFSARHGDWLERLISPCQNCPDYIYMGESEEEDIGDTMDLSGYFEDLKTVDTSDDSRRIPPKPVKVTKEMIEDAKLLLLLMGVPVLTAPCEADAQCAALVKAGKADAVVSDELDALAFGTEVLLRGLHSQKEPITEIRRSKVLEGFEMTHSQFVDLCILLGSDYCGPIAGIGPGSGFKLIKQFTSLEHIVEFVQSNTKRWEIPAYFPFPAARNFLLTPEVLPPDSIPLLWSPPDEQQLRYFLVCVKSFVPMKVDMDLKRLQRLMDRPAQTKLELFFGEGPAKRGAAGGNQPSKKAKTNRKFTF